MKTFELAGDIATPPGYLHGMRHVAVRARLKISPCAGLLERLAQLESSLEQQFPEGLAEGRPEDTGDSPLALGRRLLFWVHQLQWAARWPVFEQGRVLPARGPGADVLLAIATVSMQQSGTVQALAWVLEAFNTAAEGGDAGACLRNLAPLRKRLARDAGSSSNMPRFLRAAHELGMPYDRLVAGVYTFGQGERMRWLDSTFTDATARISAELARDKTMCADVLRKSGLPAPVHRLVRSADKAAQAAAELGYPVVVKPADLDGGVAVAAGLENEEEVRQAYATAHAKSPRVLVERHFEGRDYRLTVFQGEMIWAIERQPGGVTGDGSHTVAQLVDALNRDPRRDASPLAPLKELRIDDEARTLLARQALALDGVPPAGRFVRMRRASNVAMGGMPVAVMDQVHPDNAELAVRAAAALRLDLAGVDLLIEDISRSWLETGALICEVNAQPSLGQTTAAHLYAPILRALVQGDGRIPIAVVVGAADSEAMGAAVVAELARQGCSAAWAGPSGAGMHDSALMRSPLKPFEASQVVLLDRRVQAAVVFVNHAAAAQSGLAFSRFDVFLQAGTAVAGTQGAADDEGAARRAATLVQALAPHCDGAAAHLAGLPAPERSKELPAARAVPWLARQLLAAGERRGSSYNHPLGPDAAPSLRTHR